MTFEFKNGERDGVLRAPSTLEEAFQAATNLAQMACDEIFATTGERPHVERRAKSIVIVWPDGEVTNEIEVEQLQ